MSEQKSILVVEDDEAIRDALQELIAEEARTVVTAANGEAAIAFLDQVETLPGLIFLDLMMPGLGGKGFLAKKATRERLARIPVVVITASSLDATDSSIIGHVRKPIVLDEILGYARRYSASSSPAQI